MNTNNFFCPIQGCLHSRRGTANPFSSKTVLLHHLNCTSHVFTHSMVNHSSCAALGIYLCCATSCPSSPKTFFSSLCALNDHCIQAHPPPCPPPPAPNILSPDTNHSSPYSFSTQLIHIYSPLHTDSHWEHGLNSSTLYIITNLLTSEPHGTTSFAPGIFQHSLISKPPSSKPFLLLPIHVTPLIAQIHSGSCYSTLI